MKQVFRLVDCIFFFKENVWKGRNVHAHLCNFVF